jgi:4-amino-4-deoxy-L-arabinose transferase-like glycosyltransferase
MKRTSNAEASPPLSPLYPEPVAASGLWRWALPLILLVYVALACYHASVMPAGFTGYQNAPDEAAHVQYVRSLTRGVMPTQATAAGDPLGYEWHQPPLYYAIGTAFLPMGEKGLRGLSIVCGLLSLLVIYRTARLFVPNEPEFAVLATGIAAFIPTHIALTSAVNNDALLELLCCVVLLLLLTAFRSGLNVWRATWIGVCIGLALLTKVTGLLLLPTALFAFGLMRMHGETPKTLWRGVAAMLAGFVVVGGWWFVRNRSLYGQFLPLEQFNAAFSGTAQAQILADAWGGWGAYWQRSLRETFQSFWAVFGTPRDAGNGMPRFLPDQIYLLFGLAALVVVGGMTRLHFRRKTEFLAVQQHYLWTLFAFLGLVAAAFLLFLSKYYQVQGRYLFPAMLPLSVIMALGWRAALPQKYRSMGSGLLLTLLAVMSVLLLRFISEAVT